MRRPALARWPLIALITGAVLATVLTLVPARAEALASSRYCAATGFILCYRVEIGDGPFGPEFRMFYPMWTLNPWAM